MLDDLGLGGFKSSLDCFVAYKLKLGVFSMVLVLTCRLEKIGERKPVNSFCEKNYFF